MGGPEKYADLPPRVQSILARGENPNWPNDALLNGLRALHHPGVRMVHSISSNFPNGFIQPGILSGLVADAARRDLPHIPRRQIEAAARLRIAAAYLLDATTGVHVVGENELPSMPSDVAEATASHWQRLIANGRHIIR